MSDNLDPIKKVISQIQQHRDEVKLKLHLGEMDAKDEFARLEGEWKEFENDLKPLTGAIKDASQQVTEQSRNVALTALDTVAKRLEKDYQALRSKLQP